MKPCAQHKPLITWMSLGHLDADRARQLREHLAICPACQHYSREMAALCQEHQRAADLLPEAPADASFQPRLRNRIEADAARPTLARGWEAFCRRWKARSAQAAALAAVLVACLWVWSRPPAAPPAPAEVVTSHPTAPMVVAAVSQAPSLSHYRMVANTSLDALDDLLTRQAARASSPHGSFTLSTLSREMEN